MSDVNEVGPARPIVPVKRRERQEQKNPDRTAPKPKRKELPEPTDDLADHHVDEYV